MQAREVVGVYGEMEEILRAVFAGGELVSDGAVKGLHQVDTKVFAGPDLSALFQVRVENCLPHSPHPLLLFYRGEGKLKERIRPFSVHNVLIISKGQHPYLPG